MIAVIRGQLARVVGAPRRVSPDHADLHGPQREEAAMAPGAHTVAVIGTGKIGELVLSGLLRTGWPADKLVATARRSERAEQLTQRYGVRVVDNLTAVAEADVLAIAVKPQDAGALLDDIRPKAPADKLVVSLCAALPTSFFAP